MIEGGKLRLLHEDIVLLLQNQMALLYALLSIVERDDVRSLMKNQIEETEKALEDHKTTVWLTE